VVALFVLAAVSFIFTVRGRLKSKEGSQTPLREAMAGARDDG
jgi:hypothetical protein